MRSEEVPEEKFLGCLVGNAVGDAIGEIAFRVPDQQELRSYVQQTVKIQYTDDTAMALGIAEAILSGEGEIDRQGLGEIFRRNYNREPWRGYGPGPPALFRMVEEEGLDYVEAAGRLFGGEGSMGNGAAMRVAPVGVFYAGTGRVYEMAVRSAEVTHTHRLGRDGAGVLATAVAKAALCSPDQKVDATGWAEDLAQTARTEEFTEAMERVGELLESGAGRREAAGRLGTGVLIHRSVPYAVWSFLRAPNSFEDCLMNAIMAGGDRDTIGAMACAISGTCLGADAVAGQWLDRLENGEHIRDLARGLHKLRSQVTL